MLVPIQLESTLAAVRATPSRTTAGKVQPSGPLPAELPDHLGHHVGHCAGCRGPGCQHLVTLSGQAPHGQVDYGPLDAGTAYIDSESELGHGLILVTAAFGPGASR